MNINFIEISGHDRDIMLEILDLEGDWHGSGLIPLMDERLEFVSYDNLLYVVGSESESYDYNYLAIVVTKKKEEE